MRTVFIILAFLLMISCKKEPTGPSIYNFKVIDDYTNLPLSDCNVYFKDNNCTISTTTLIGKTDTNGTFTYICNDNLDFENHDYYIHITKTGYFDFNNSTNIELTHENRNINLRYKKQTIFCFKVRRITLQSTCPQESFKFHGCLMLKSPNMLYSTPSLNFYDFVPAYPNQYYRTSTIVPSKSLFNVIWSTKYESTCFGHLDSLNNIKEILSGYNDTTFFNIDW